MHSWSKSYYVSRDTVILSKFYFNPLEKTDEFLIYIDSNLHVFTIFKNGSYLLLHNS